MKIILFSVQRGKKIQERELTLSRCLLCAKQYAKIFVVFFKNLTMARKEAL
jgi:hypothetical protein